MAATHRTTRNAKSPAVTILTAPEVTDDDFRRAMDVDYEIVSELPSGWRRILPICELCFGNCTGSSRKAVQEAVSAGRMESKRFKIRGVGNPFTAYRPVKPLHNQQH